MKPIKPVFGKQAKKENTPSQPTTTATTATKTKSAPKIKKEPKKPQKKITKNGPSPVNRNKSQVKERSFDGYEDDIEDLDIFKVHGFSMKDLGVNNSTIDLVETEEIQDVLNEDDLVDLPEEKETKKSVKEPKKAPVAEPKKPCFGTASQTKKTKTKRTQRKTTKIDADVKQEYDPDAPIDGQKVRKRQSKPRTKRPDTYKERIKMAIRNCGGSSAVHMIYKFMEERWPEDYVADKKQQWQNSIRHNLSLHKKDFRRIHKNGRQEWAVVEEEGRLSAIPTEEDETNARRSRKRKHHHKQIVEKPRKVDLRIPLNKQLFEAHTKGTREVILVSQRDAIVLCNYYKYFFYEMGNTASWMQRLTFQAIQEDEPPQRLCPGVVPIPTEELIKNTIAAETKKANEMKESLQGDIELQEVQAPTQLETVTAEQTQEVPAKKLKESEPAEEKLLAKVEKSPKKEKETEAVKPVPQKEPAKASEPAASSKPFKPVFGRARKPVFISPFIKKNS